jgi:DUF971 family protein
MSIPSRVVIPESKDALILSYSNGQEYILPAEYLRVYSPSAEVRGHGEGNENLQFGKRLVTINTLEKSGNYALQIVFSDGHDSGIYSWDYLQALAEDYEEKWANYLKKLHNAGLSRDLDAQVIKLM